jgi:hypothetical protein
MLLFLVTVFVNQTAGEDSLKVAPITITDKDTLPTFNMPEVRIIDERVVEERMHSRRFRRLLRDVQKTMPYAKEGAKILHEIDSALSTMESGRERDQYIKDAEKRLMKEFESDLKQLNRRQGLILLKLIDRETGNTSYDLIRDYRSRFSAVFWQGFARVFGMNLRTVYDPEEEQDIEMAIYILGYE